MKKELALLIASKLPKPKGKVVEDDEPMDDEDEAPEADELPDGAEEAAEEVFAAMESKDAKALAIAVRDLVRICE